MKISQRDSKLLSVYDFRSDIFQGEYFSKNEGRVMVLALCKLSDTALYLYQD